MTDAFAELGLPRSAAPDADEVRRRFDELSRERHPDSGGDAAAFQRLNEASAILLSPARRLRHLVELHSPGTRLEGPMAPELIDLFGRLAPDLQAAQALVARRERAASALSRALLLEEELAVRERLEEHAAQLQQRLQQVENRAAALPPGELAEPAREAAFLERWQAQVRALLGQLGGL